MVASMSKNWDFREILDLHPEWDDRCVAIKVRSEERCGIYGKAGRRNLTEAGVLLDKMNRTLSLSECCKNLDKLAYLTMCGNPHRNMTDVQVDRCRRWKNQISAYIASEEGKEVLKRNLEEALESKNKGQDAAIKSGNNVIVQLASSSTIKSQKPPVKASEHTLQLQSSNVKSISYIEDPFIDTKKAMPVPQLQLGHSIEMTSRLDTVHLPLDTRTSRSMDMKDPKIPNPFIEKQSSTQTFGLQTPPTVPVSFTSKGQDALHIYSPPKTPTGAVVPRKYTDLGSISFRSSDKPLKPAARVTQSLVESGTKEPATSSGMFIFGSLAQKSAPLPSSGSKVKLKASKLTNFAEEFGSRGDATKIFKFELPSKTIDQIKNQEPPSSEAKSEVTAIASNLTVHPTSTSSSNDENLALDSKFSKNNLELIPPSVVWPKLPPLSEKMNKDLGVSGQAARSSTEETFHTWNAFNKELPISERSSLSTPSVVLPFLPVLNHNQKPLPGVDTGFLEPSVLPSSAKSTGEEQDLGFRTAQISHSLATKPKTAAYPSKLFSSKKHKAPSAPLDSLSTFKFGSDSRIASKTFDFETLPKVSLVLEMPRKSSTIWSSLLSDQNSAQNKITSRESVEVDNEVKTIFKDSKKDEDCEGRSVSEMSAESLDAAPAIELNKIQNVSGALDMPIKINARQFGGLLTPEGTPEPLQGGAALLPLSEGSIKANSTPVPTRTPTTGSHHSLNENPILNEDIPQRRRSEDEDLSEIIEQKLQMSTEIDESDMENPTQIEAIPHIHNGLIAVTPKEIDSSFEDTFTEPIPDEPGEDDGNEEVVTVKIIPGASQAIKKFDNTIAKENLTEAEHTSRLDLLHSEVNSATNRKGATAEVDLESLQLDLQSDLQQDPQQDLQHHLVAEEDVEVCKVESVSPQRIEEAASVDEQEHVISNIVQELAGQDGEAPAVMEADSQISPITNINLGLKKAESFGHALIDPLERRYKTRFSERQRQANLQIAQAQEVTHIVGDKNAFFGAEAHLEPFITQPSSEVSSKLTSIKRREVPKAPSNKGSYVLTGEYIEWENDRGLPKEKKGRRLSKDVWRHVRDSLSNVSEAVRRKPQI